MLFHFVQNCPEGGDFKVLNEPPGSVFTPAGESVGLLSANILIGIDALIKVGLPPEPANQKLERTSALNLGLPKNIVELLN